MNVYTSINGLRAFNLHALFIDLIHCINCVVFAANKDNYYSAFNKV